MCTNRYVLDLFTTNICDCGALIFLVFLCELMLFYDIAIADTQSKGTIIVTA